MKRKRDGMEDRQKPLGITGQICGEKNLNLYSPFGEREKIVLNNSAVKRQDGSVFRENVVKLTGKIVFKVLLLLVLFTFTPNL